MHAVFFPLTSTIHEDVLSLNSLSIEPFLSWEYIDSNWLPLNRCKPKVVMRVYVTMVEQSSKHKIRCTCVSVDTHSTYFVYKILADKSLVSIVGFC